MAYFCHQPLIIEIRQRVLGHLQDPTTAKCPLVTLTVDLQVSAAQAFQLSTAELVAMLLFAGGTMPCCGERVIGCAFADVCCTRIPGARAHRGERGIMALEQFADHRFLVLAEGIVAHRHEQRFLGKTQAVIGQHQHMAVVLMLEVIVDAFFLAQSLQQRQVGFIVLDAKRSQWIVPGCQFKAITAGGQSMLLKQLAQDHGHAGALENTSTSLLIQRLDTGHQRQFVGDPVSASMFTTGTVQHAMNALVVAELEDCRLVQQSLKVQGRCQPDDLDVESIGLVESFMTTEPYHLETQVVVEKREGGGTFLVVVHRTRYRRGVGCRAYETPAHCGHAKATFPNRPTTAGEDVDASRDFLVDCQL